MTKSNEQPEEDGETTLSHGKGIGKERVVSLLPDTRHVSPGTGESNRAMLTL